MTLNSLVRMVATADVGAVIMSLDQTVLFWNREAERLLGYPPAQVIGRRCFEAGGGPFGDGLTPDCANGCLTMRAVRTGQTPSARAVPLRAADGERRLMHLTPMVVATDAPDSPLIVHLFEAPDADYQPLSVPAAAGVAEAAAPTERPPAAAAQRPLSPRELQVLQLVADGRSTESIAEELEISLHTVRNHIRNLRRKLDAHTKLEAVIIALRTGLIRSR